MAGLGFANPELKKAQLLAQLNGSTAVPMGGQPPAPQMPQMPTPQRLPMPNMDVQPQAAPTPQPLPMPNMDVAPPQVGPQAPDMSKAPKGGKDIPQWAKIAGAIGHIILSADAGYNGRAMPESPFGGQHSQDQEMQVQRFLMNTTARAWEAIRKAPPEQREQIKQMYADAISKVDPSFDFNGFMDKTASDADWVDQIAPDVATFSDDAQTMFMAKVRQHGGDPATAAADVLKDQAFMKSLQDFDDQKNVPVLKYKLQRIKAAMVSMQMAPDTFGGMTMDDLRRINDELPESVRLTPSELSSLARHPEMAGVIGMSPPKDDSEPTGLDHAAGYQPPSRPAPYQRPRHPEDPGDEGNEEEPPPDDQTEDAPDPVAPPPRRPAGPPPTKRPAAPAPRSQQGPQTKPPAPKEKPYYPPGWKPRTPAVPTTKVDAVGKRPSKQAAAPVQKPAGQQGEKRIRVPKDMTIPGYGQARKGDVLIYDYATGQYRRG